MTAGDMNKDWAFSLTEALCLNFENQMICIPQLWAGMKVIRSVGCFLHKSNRSFAIEQENQPHTLSPAAEEMGKWYREIRHRKGHFLQFISLPIVRIGRFKSPLLTTSGMFPLLILHPHSISFESTGWFGEQQIHSEALWYLQVAIGFSKFRRRPGLDQSSITA